MTPGCIRKLKTLTGPNTVSIKNHKADEPPENLIRQNDKAASLGGREGQQHRHHRPRGRGGHAATILRTLMGWGLFSYVYKETEITFVKKKEAKLIFNSLRE